MQHAQNGFTLIELLLYVAIIGTLLTAVMGFYGLALDARVKNQAIAEVNQQGGLALDQITQTIRNASSVTAPVAASSGSTLTLAVPTASLSPTTYNVANSTLQITEGTGSAVALTSGDVKVTSITFTNLTRSGTNGIVQVTITVEYTNNTGRAAYSYQKIFTTSAEVGV